MSTCLSITCSHRTCSWLQKQRDMSQQLKTSIYDLIMQKNSTYGCKNVNFSRSPPLSLYTASLRNTRFFLYAIPQWSSDQITCLLSEQSNEVIITQRESINPTQESRGINAPIQAPVIGHRERECERWRERERKSPAGEWSRAAHWQLPLYEGGRVI